MKKSVKAFIASLAVLLCGCNKSTSTTDTIAEEIPQETEVAEEAEATEEAESASVYHFYQLNEDDDEIINFYRFEVSKRQKSDADFITQDEESWYEENGYSVTNKEDGVVYLYKEVYREEEYYFYPVLVYINGKEAMIYTDEKGSVHAEHHWVDDLHLTYAEKTALGEVEVMSEGPDQTMVYIPEKGIQVYQFGKLVESLPINGVYAGKSFWVGYIFRDGTDVYAVTWDEEQGSYQSKVIAHGVKYVIDADYDLASDPWSQPLFLMEDGSIKAYLDYNNKEVPDSPDNLVDPMYEGGYYK